MAKPWLDFTRVFVPRLQMPNAPMQGDWQPWLQAALDELINNNEPAPPAGRIGAALRSLGTLYLAPGEYRIDRPLILHRAQGSQPVSVSIVGECSPLSAGYARGVQIIASFNDAPAIIIQGGVDVELRNLVIQGPAQGTGALTRAFDHLQEDLAGKTDVYVAGNPRDNRSSPHAGVCIDPFHPSLAESDRYPRAELAVEYTQPGLVVSRHVRIADCLITGFLVGVCVTPCGQDPDESLAGVPILMMTNSRIDGNKVSVSTGTRRRILLARCSLFGAKIGLDCAGYSGPAPAPGQPWPYGACPSMQGGNVGAMRYLLRVGATGAHATFSGVFGESLLSLGQVGAAGAGTDPIDSLTFSGCTFKMMTSQGAEKDDSDPPQPLPQVPAMNAHLINQALLTFNGCFLKVEAPDVASIPREPLHIINQGVLAFHGCTLGIQVSTNNQDYGPPFWISGDTSQVTFTQCLVPDRFPGAQGDVLAKPVVFSSLNIIDSFNAAPGGGEGNIAYLQFSTWPGTLYFFHNAADQRQLTEGTFVANSPAFDSDPVFPPVRMVRGEWPLPLLLKTTIGKSNLDQAELQQGRLTLKGIDPGITLPGDVLMATIDRGAAPEQVDLPGVLLNPGSGPALAAPLLLGRIIDIQGTDALVHYVPFTWYSLLSFQDVTVNIYLAYFPRVHCPTKGNLQQGLTRIFDVSTNPLNGKSSPPSVIIDLPSAWGKYQRIRGEAIKPGTYIVDIILDAATNSYQIEMSTRASQNKDNERLYDAAVASFDDVVV